MLSVPRSKSIITSYVGLINNIAKYNVFIENNWVRMKSVSKGSDISDMKRKILNYRRRPPVFFIY